MSLTENVGIERRAGHRGGVDERIFICLRDGELDVQVLILGAGSQFNRLVEADLRVADRAGQSAQTELDWCVVEDGDVVVHLVRDLGQLVAGLGDVDLRPVAVDFCGSAVAVALVARGYDGGVVLAELVPEGCLAIVRAGRRAGVALAVLPGSAVADFQREGGVLVVVQRCAAADHVGSPGDSRGGC